MILKHLDEETNLIDSKKVCIGGLSQGAIMSLKVGLEYPKTLGGIFSFSGVFAKDLAV